MPEVYRYYTRDVVPQRFADLTCPRGYKPPPTVTFRDPATKTYVTFYHDKAFNIGPVEPPKKKRKK